MIQVMRELSAEFNFFCEKSAESVSETIGKLSNVNLLVTIQLDYVHFVLNLIIDEFQDAIICVNFFNER